MEMEGGDCHVKTPSANRITQSNMELKDNTIIVVLGASGDLAKKKTVSAYRATSQER
jgi:hypothetical protein